MATRNRAWADIVQNSLTLSSGGFILSNLLVSAPEVDTLTATRIIGDLQVYYDPTSGSVDSAQLIEVGIGVTSSEAFAGGRATVPDPSQGTQYPPRGWLYAASQVAWSRVDSAGVQMHMARFIFDLGAMRKIDKGLLYMMVTSTLGKGAGITTLVSGRVRTLCLT